jgi:hypothetical protein
VLAARGKEGCIIHDVKEREDVELADHRSSLEWLRVSTLSTRIAVFF